MLYEYISLIFGSIKLILYKVIYFFRIRLKFFPKMNASFKIAIKKKSKLIIGKNFRARNNISFRIYNRGIVKIGNNCFFNDGVSIISQKAIIIGDNVIVGPNVHLIDNDHDYKKDINNFILGDIQIGNNVWIGDNVIILKGVTIGNNVVIAAGCIINKDVPDNTVIYQKRESIFRKR